MRKSLMMGDERSSSQQLFETQAKAVTSRVLSVGRGSVGGGMSNTAPEPPQTLILQVLQGNLNQFWRFR
jgi:hypothetical protein